VAFAAITDCRIEMKLGFVVKRVGSSGIVLVWPILRVGDGGDFGRKDRTCPVGFDGSGK
jgi:hypothetical protein